MVAPTLLFMWKFKIMGNIGTQIILIIFTEIVPFPLYHYQRNKSGGSEGMVAEFISITVPSVIWELQSSRNNYKQFVLLIFRITLVIIRIGELKSGKFTI